MNEVNVKNVVIAEIANFLGSQECTPKDAAVLSILMLHWGGDRIKQKDIIEHPYWKKLTTGTAQPATIMRELRRVIRNLRVRHNIPILHSSEGHYLPETQAEVDEFVSRLEREVKRHTSSSLETYQTMKNSLGITSQVFDMLDVAGVQVITY